MQNKDFLHKLYGWRERAILCLLLPFWHIAIHKESKKRTKTETSSMTLKAAQRYDNIWKK